MTTRFGSTSLVLLSITSLVSSRALAQTTYRVVDLGEIAGATATRAWALDEGGGAAGESGRHAVRFLASGAIVDYGAIDTRSIVLSVNASGSGVGFSAYEDASTGTFNRAQLFRPDGTHVALSPFSQGAPTAARAINASGVIVGEVDHNAVRFDGAGGWTLLASTSLLPSHAYGLDSAGNAVGQATWSGVRIATSFPAGGGATQLGMLPGAISSFAYDVNDAGVAVGWSELADHRPIATRFGPGGPESLGTLDPASSTSTSIADDVNGMGVAVGGSNGRAVRFDANGVVRDLNAMLDASGAGWTLVYAHAIDETGRIAGEGVRAGEVRAFRLDPIASIASYCAPGPNSAGNGVRLSASGTPSVGARDLVLVANGGVPNRPGLFFYGDQTDSVPFGNGTRCVGGNVWRMYPTVTFDASGATSRAADFDREGAGALRAGCTWYFQLFYRDGSSGSPSVNLSDALAVSFGP